MSTPGKNGSEVTAAANPSSRTASQTAVMLDPEIEKRVLRKLDFRVVPVLWFLFLVSFVDRGNIGNAKIQGMDKSLSLLGNRYNIAVMVFTLAYVVFGVPANIIFKKIGTKSLSVMMFIWGICAIGQGLTRSWGGLVACRFLMGVFEAGFVPGCAFLIGSYYKREEFLRRYAVFFSAAIIAGAFNGLFATLLSMADGAGGYEGWRWIFLAEGMITCVSAAVAFFFIVPLPEQNHKTFTPEEKAVLMERIRQDETVEPEHSGKHIMEALTDWKIWLAMITYFGTEENASSVVGFQPTVLKGLGYSSTSAQVHSIPIYCVAFVGSLLCAWSSEKLHQRYFFALFGSIWTTIGIAIQLAQPHSVGVRYAGLFFLTLGTYITMPIIVVWSAINVDSTYKRVVAFGLVIATGNAGALVSSNVFITREMPKYHTGFAVGLGMNCLAITCMTALYIGLLLQNRKKDRHTLGSKELESNDRLSGERQPSFRYQL